MQQVSFPRYLFGDCAFDVGTFQLRKGAEPQAVEPKALDVLRLLLERAPQVVEKSEIFSTVWKDVAVTDNALTRVVAQLRKALGDDAKEPRYIATVSTRGYRIVCPVNIVSATTNDEGVSEATRPPTMPAVGSPAGRRPRARAAMAGALAVVLIAGVSLWLATRARSRLVDQRRIPSAATLDPATLSGLTPMRLASSKGFDGFLAFSPDGGSIAYSSDRSGAMEVYVQGVAEGSTATLLTVNGHQNVQPVWSPDGRFIAFHEMAGNGIWLVSSRGGAARKLSDFGAHPSWSPDGRRLVFQSQPLSDLNPGGSFGPTSTIWSVTIDGHTPPVPLTQPGQPSGSHGMPAWWPDGRRVVFAVNDQSGPRLTPSLWSVDAEGGAPQELSAHARMSSEFAISPDARGIYFSAGASHAIWWLPVDDPGKAAGEPRPTGLPVTGSALAGIAVSADGRHIGWTAIDSSATIWAVPVAGTGGTQPVPLAGVDEVGWRAGFPAVASDGRVAFMGNRGNAGNQIYLAIPNAAPKQLTTDARDHGGPYWLEDDKEIAVISNHGDGPGYWALNPDTGHERLLFRLSAIPTPPTVQSQVRGPAAGLSFTRDLSRLAVAYIRDGIPNIWTMPFGAQGPAGPFVQRTFEKQGGSYAAWSPDGRWIAYQCNEGTNTNVCVIGSDGNGRTQLTRDEGQAFIGGWTPDINTVVFAARRHAVWNVTSVSRSSGATRTLTSFTESRFYVRYPRWDATNSRVVFERFETTGRLWSVDLPAGH